MARFTGHVEIEVPVTCSATLGRSSSIASRTVWRSSQWKRRPDVLLLSAFHFLSVLSNPVRAPFISSSRFLSEDSNVLWFLIGQVELSGCREKELAHCSVATSSRSTLDCDIGDGEGGVARSGVAAEFQCDDAESIWQCARLDFRLSVTYLSIVDWSVSQGPPCEYRWRTHLEMYFLSERCLDETWFDWRAIDGEQWYVGEGRVWFRPVRVVLRILMEMIGERVMHLRFMACHEDPRDVK